MIVRVGGVDYEVVYVPGLADGQQKLDGHIQYGPCRISIEAALSHQMQQIVLWHEMLHAILTHAGQEQLSESVMDALAYGIVQVLRDWPDDDAE